MPDDVRPELFNGAADDRASPHDGIGLIFQQDVDGHDVDAGLGADRVDAGLIAGRLLLQTEDARDGRTGNIRIHDADIQAAALHDDRQKRRDHRLANATLARNNADHFLDRRQRMRLFVHVRRLLSGRTVAAAGAAIMRAVLGFTHFIDLQYFRASAQKLFRCIPPLLIIDPFPVLSRKIKRARFHKESAPKPDDFMRRIPPCSSRRGRGGKALRSPAHSQGRAPG